MQASQRVKPILDQAAAAAAALTDASGAAKAEVAARKAKKLTPEEMKLMRQQADPTFASKKDAPKKAKAAKAAKAAPAAAVKDAGGAGAAVQQATATAKDAAAEMQSSLVQQGGGHVHVSTDATAGAASAGILSKDAQAKSTAGNKRHHGLGFVEEQPNAKRSKQHDGQPVSAPSNDGVAPKSSAQQHQPAQTGGEGSKAEKQRQQGQGMQQEGQGMQQEGQGHKPSGQGSQQEGQGRQAPGQGSQPTRQGPQATGQTLPSQATVIFTDECTAFIRGLDSKVTEAELKTLLTPCGDIKDIRIVMDKATHRPKVISQESLVFMKFQPA